MSDSGPAKEAFSSAAIADKNAALMDAAKQGKEDAMWTALMNGADPNCTDDNNNTPLMFAANQGFVEVVRGLLQSGADPLRRNKDGMTALMASLDLHNKLAAKIDAGEPHDPQAEAGLAYRRGLIGGALYQAEKAATERTVATCNNGVEENLTVNRPIKFKFGAK